MPYFGNQLIVGDSVNNFKVLDDISTYTETFDGSSSSVVSTAAETIKIIDKVQERSDLSALEEELYSSYDPYQYIRDSYIQNRDYKMSDGTIEDELEDELFDLEDF